jgi:hypothetical protein
VSETEGMRRRGGSAVFLLAPRSPALLSVDAFGETADPVQQVFVHHFMLTLFFVSAGLGAPSCGGYSTGNLWSSWV